MLSCHQTTRLLSEAQDRKLGTYEALSLKMHVLMCGACRNFGHQMNSLRRFARAYASGASEGDNDSN